MRKKPRNLGVAIGVAALVLFGGVVGATAWWMAQPAAHGTTPRVRVTIVPRTSAAAVGRLLQSKGIIRSAFAWERFVARGEHRRIARDDVDLKSELAAGVDLGIEAGAKHGGELAAQPREHRR